jgi:hypothetical protein
MGVNIMAKPPKLKALKVTPPMHKIEPQVIEYPIILKPHFMMQVGTAEPFAIPPECIEVVDS